MNKYIEINPKIMNGKPCIKGTRIPVYMILEMLSSKLSYEQILDEYSQLNLEQILACCEFGASVTKFEEYELA